MNIRYANIKSIKADLAKHRITMSFEMELDRDTIRTSEELAIYINKKDAGDLELSIIPRQALMFENDDDDHDDEV